MRWACPILLQHLDTAEAGESDDGDVEGIDKNVFKSASRKRAGEPDYLW
jgi:hypothetical protein